MKDFAPNTPLTKKAKEMNGKLPSQFDNIDYGKKRKAKLHKFSVKDSKTKKTYWIPTTMESLSFSDFLLIESSTDKYSEPLTALPEMLISELRKLINVGSKDLTQNWANALELVNTAFHVSNIKRPNPLMKGAWKQYEQLIKYGVTCLQDTRGVGGKWRSSDIMYAESIVSEANKSNRFFVKIPGTSSVEIEASDMSEVIRELSNKIKRHGASTEIIHRDQNGTVLGVLKNGEVVEEIIIQNLS